MNSQRGDGVFSASIAGLRQLNALGYGQPGSGLTLNLVYNPLGPSLPPTQAPLELAYKEQLATRYGIVFNQLFALTNMPIQRFGSQLLADGRFDTYLALLQGAHRPENMDGVMCRRLVSIGWDGRVYDCDFNQMLGLPLGAGGVYLRDVLNTTLEAQPISVAGHCHGCTAGQGSSCGGALD